MPHPKYYADDKAILEEMLRLEKEIERSQAEASMGGLTLGADALGLYGLGTGAKIGTKMAMGDLPIVDMNVPHVLNPYGQSEKLVDINTQRMAKIKEADDARKEMVNILNDPMSRFDNDTLYQEHLIPNYRQESVRANSSLNPSKENVAKSEHIAQALDDILKRQDKLQSEGKLTDEIRQDMNDTLENISGMLATDPELRVLVEQKKPFFDLEPLIKRQSENRMIPKRKDDFSEFMTPQQAFLQRKEDAFQDSMGVLEKTRGQAFLADIGLQDERFLEGTRLQRQNAIEGGNEALEHQRFQDLNKANQMLDKQRRGYSELAAASIPFIGGLDMMFNAYQEYTQANQKLQEILKQSTPEQRAQFEEMMRERSVEKIDSAIDSYAGDF